MEKNKNRKNKKGLEVILLFLIIIAGAGAYCWYLPRVSAADESEVPVLEEGQEYAYAKITSILGNEIEYIVVDAQTIDSADFDEKSSRRKERNFGEKSSTRDNTDSMQNTAIITYTETDVTGQMQIPVGTEVETKLGTITTFSRLSNGDIIKMLLQKEDAGKKALMKIWIME